jgi:hypothetical protein
MSISERAIAVREARHRASKQRDTAPSKDINRDPFYRCEPGTYGHPQIVIQRKAEDDEKLMERAQLALNWGSNSRFRRLVARFNRFMR